MKVDKLTRQTEMLRAGITALRQRAARYVPGQQPLPAEAFADLDTALDQLEAAQEEIRQQADELTAADEALQAERQRYHELFQFAPDSYLVTDARGVIQEANQAACALLNTSYALLARKGLVLFVAQADQRAFVSYLQSARRGAGVVEWTMRLRPRRQGARRVSVRVARGRERDGLPVLYWLLRDVTEREQLADEQVRLRQQAQAGEAKLRAVLESIPDSIVLSGGDGRIVLVNRGAENLFGYTRDEMIGQPVEMLLPARYRAAHRQHRAEYQAAPRLRQMGNGFEIYCRRKDGSEFPGEVGLSPVVPSSELLVASCHRDISERKRVEAFLSAVISAVSHDLRTPLASIKTATTTLLDETVPWQHAERRELLQTIDEAADRLTHHVSQLLSLSRLESHQLHLRREWHDLGEIVGGVARRLDPTAARVRLQVAEDLPLVYVDYFAVEQIVGNLLENALKYSPVTAPVAVSLRQQENALVVEVADRGPGIPRGETELIFEKFYRGESADADLPGTGLGLAIARGFARALGGEIAYAPRPGGGSLFALTLPIDDAPPAPGEQ
ncbi:MAG TPA: PAS domain S-box protein [Chloroflexota bacterium]|nr:PAS domain S-box protein [Chloroflexota bacterium]